MAKQDSINRGDKAIDSSSYRAHQHVGPFWFVVFEDTCYWGRLYMFVCNILRFLLKIHMGAIYFHIKSVYSIIGHQSKSQYLFRYELGV